MPGQPMRNIPLIGPPGDGPPVRRRLSDVSGRDPGEEDVWTSRLQLNTCFSGWVILGANEDRLIDQNRCTSDAPFTIPVSGADRIDDYPEKTRRPHYEYHGSLRPVCYSYGAVSQTYPGVHLWRSWMLYLRARYPYAVRG